MMAKVGSGASEGVASVWRQTRGESPKVIAEGGVSGTETVGAEGEGVIGAHGS
jgi:hypothetical protein